MPDAALVVGLDEPQYVPCPVPCSERTVALELDTDAMLPEVRRGDLLFADPERMPKPGDLVVARWGRPSASMTSNFWRSSASTGGRSG